MDSHPKESRTALTALARRALEELPLVVLAIVLVATGAELMPLDPLISVWEVKLDLARLLVLAGLGALAVVRPPRAVSTAPPGGPLARLVAWARREPLLALLALAVLALLAAGLVSTLRWEGTEPRFRFLVESVAVFGLALGVVRRRPDVALPLAGAAVIALALSAAPGIAQVSQGAASGFYRYGCLPLQAAPPLIPEGTLTRAIGSFQNPNLLAAHVLLLGPLAILAAISAGAGRQRLAFGIVAGLAYLALALTLSRAAVVIALVSPVLVAVAGQMARRGLIAAAGIVLAMVAAAALGTCGIDAASGDHGRVGTWQETARIAADEPLTGVGLGRTAEMLAARNPGSSFAHGHNLFLTWWADAGTLALLAWLAIAAVLLRLAWRGAATGDRLALALLVSLGAFFAYGLVDHPANVDRIALAFWVVAGIAAAAPWRAREAGRV